MERKQLQLKLRVKVETIWATRQCLLNYPFRACRVYVDSLNVRCRPLIDLNRVQDLKSNIKKKDLGILTSSLRFLDAVSSSSVRNSTDIPMPSSLSCLVGVVSAPAVSESNFSFFSGHPFHASSLLLFFEAVLERCC